MSSSARRFELAAAALAVCAAGVWAGCRAEPRTPRNLLSEGRLHQVRGVDDAKRLHDGVTPREGDDWESDLSAVFHGRKAAVVFDLGRSTAIDALFIVGDNNDVFRVELSDDGRSYRQVWRAGEVKRSGMRARSVRGLAERGRYLRLTARGGDRFVSVGEVVAFARAPEVWPPAVPRAHSGSPNVAAQHWLLAFAVALVLLVALADRRLPRALPVAGALAVAALFLICARELAALWPLRGDLVSSLRALLAAAAACALLLAAFARPRPAAQAAVLGLIAALSVLCFYNFGRPWFWNDAEHRPTPVHTYDMRVYFPIAKYFPELGFDGVYVASVAAYLDGEGLPPERVANVELRDLRDNRVVYAPELAEEIAAAPRRFSPERWREFVADMGFFWRLMGTRSYLGTLQDHGGNATPVWLSVAHLLFAHADASERSLTLAALLDPLLLALTFWAIGRTFGLRTMLVCIVVFGTSDFPMFGSNWAGSTLRMDWMAAIGLGACALRTGRSALGGALLAYAALARAFPALALAFAPLPAAIALFEQLARRSGSAALATVLQPLRPRLREAARMLLGAGACALVLVVLSGALFGWGAAWGGWFDKIERHADKPNTNHVGVRTVVSFDRQLTARKVLQPELPEPWTRWQQTQIATYERRAPAALALRLVLILLCVLACRGARPEQAALIGLLLIPVLFYPANYYLHYVFLLPLLAAGHGRQTLIEAVLLALGVAQWFTLDRFIDLRFYWQSVLLLVAWFVLLVPLAVDAVRGPRLAPAAPEAAPAQ